MFSPEVAGWHRRVKSTNGDTHLGGDDWDQRLTEWIIEEFKKDQGIDLQPRQNGIAATQGSGRKSQIELSRRHGRPTSTCLLLPPMLPDPSTCR